MTKIDAVRQWVGAIFAFVAVAIAYGHSHAGVEIALAMPKAIFFVCMAGYSSRQKISELQTQIDELRRSIDGRA